MAGKKPEKYLKELFSLEGKSAVVTGGTGVLCGAIAKGYWKAGAKVLLVGRSREKAEAHIRDWQAPHEEVRFYKADVTRREGLEGVAKKALEHFGRIDIWINGAGINSSTSYLEITDEEWESLLATNLKSVHMGCQVIGGYWLSHREKGCIINISSMSALRPLSKVFTYSLSKAALWNLTQNLSREWADRGIRVNALCPGFFPAEQNRKLLDKSRIESILVHTPMDRFGEADELVGAALLLASEKAGSFITGTNLVVDGGFSVTSI